MAGIYAVAELPETFGVLLIT